MVIMPLYDRYAYSRYDLQIILVQGNTKISYVLSEQERSNQFY